VRGEALEISDESFALFCPETLLLTITYMQALDWGMWAAVAAPATR